MRKIVCAPENLIPQQLEEDTKYFSIYSNPRLPTGFVAQVEVDDQTTPPFKFPDCDMSDSDERFKAFGFITNAIFSQLQYLLFPPKDKNQAVNLGDGVLTIHELNY